MAALAQMFAAVAAELHTLARNESAHRKGRSEWPAWAQLQSTVRDTMLRASICRKLAESLKTSTGQ